MSMINNNFNNTRSTITYVYYELSLLEEITNKKFFFNMLSNDRFELSVCKTKDEDDINDDNMIVIN